MNKKFDELITTMHHGINPYNGYDRISGDWPASHWGEWGSGHGFFHQLIDTLRPKLIIEVGSFLGGSAITMGRRLRLQKLNDSAVLCVDTWLAEDILWSMPEHREKLKITYGTPCFYYTFLSNIIDQGLADRVVPLRMPSLSAARYLKRLNLMAEVIYIDGSHEEGDALRDMQFYWDRLCPGGAMLVDDYWEGQEMFAGLIRDIHRFEKETGVKMQREAEKVIFWKPELAEK